MLAQGGHTPDADASSRRLRRPQCSDARDAFGGVPLSTVSRSNIGTSGRVTPGPPIGPKPTRALPVDLGMGVLAGLVRFGLVAALTCCLARPAAAAGLAPRTTAPAPPGNAELRDLGDGVRVSISPGTSVVDMGMVSLPSGFGYTVRAFALRLEQGRIDVLVPPVRAAARPVLVRTSRQVTAVSRRGGFTVIANREDVTVAAYESALAVTAGQRWLSVPAGNRVIVSAESPTGRLAQLPPAPSVTFAGQLHVATPGSTNPFLVTVRTDTPAQGYRVTLVDRTDPLRAPLVYESEDPIMALSPVEPGRYLLEARAIDASGLEGLVSTPVAIRIVGLGLPPGGYVRQGAPQLAPGQHVNLIRAEGLQLTYGSSDYFITAPTTVGLRRGRAVVARIRDPELAAEARLSLEPSEPLNMIRLEPANAVWPRDRIRIQLEFRGETERKQFLEGINLSPVVTINDVELKVSWACARISCQADVPPPSTHGPWILRVELHDGSGQAVDHTFLEIADVGKRP